VKYLLPTILFCLFSVVSAQEIKSELRILPEALEYREGDLVEIDLKIWPIENADFEEFRKIEGVTLFNALDITQVSSVENSPNNADVVIIKAIAVVLKEPDASSAFIQYKNNNIAVAPQHFKLIPLKVKSEEFYILDQSISRRYLVPAMLAFLVVIITVGIMYRRKYLAQKNNKKDPREEYKKLFLSAEDRTQFEEVYARRKEWVPLLTAETIAHREFFKVMEMHQYKQDWDADEKIEVKNSFEIIRGSFS
jgi:hypothetical protein